LVWTNSKSTAIFPGALSRNNFLGIDATVSGGDASRRLYVAMWARLLRGSFLEVLLKIDTKNRALLSGKS
jgi:hypothetical protein